MKVRYGKPIRAKNLLEQSNIPFSYTAANATFYPLTTGTFYSYAGPSVLNIKYVNRQANHKYFLFLNIDTVYSWSYFGIWDTYSTGYDGNRAVPTKDGNNYYALISPTTSAANGVPTFQFGGTQNLPSTANYALIIDLTEIGLDNLTAEEFYNRYKGKFGLLATGEEITLDRKVGQVSYDKKVILQSLWGDQSNLTAVQPSVSGNYIYLGKNGYSAQSAYNINTNLEDFNTPIISGHKYILILYQTGSSAYYMIAQPNIDKWKWTSAGQLIPGQLSYSYYAADDDVILKNFYWSGSVTPTLYKDFFIDLTDAFGAGNEPTATEFYNKYKGYFLSLTKGERVIVGKGKIAGGSSDVYYGYNQLAELPETSGTKWRGYSCTMTAENGVATCVATGGNYPALASQFYKTIYELDHIYMHLAKFKQDTAVTSGAFAINTNGMSTKLSGNSTTVVGEWVDLYFFGRGQGTSTYQNTFNIQGGANAVSGTTFYVKDCICIDLTDWFGAGKEPSTVEEFKEKFTKEYYGFCPTPIKLTRYQIEVLPNYGYNQLVKNGNFVDISCWSPTYGDITTNDNICTYTITQVGTVGSNQNRINYAQSWQTNISAQHKFLFASEIYCKYAQNLSFIVHDRSNGYRDVISASKKGVANSWNELSAIMTAKYDCLASNADMRIGFSSTADSAVGDKYYAKNFILVDLTDWYGEGNEPTTVEEFKRSFPNKYYPYSKKRLLNKYMINKLVG